MEANNNTPTLIAFTRGPQGPSTFAQSLSRGVFSKIGLLTPVDTLPRHHQSDANQSGVFVFCRTGAEEQFNLGLQLNPFFFCFVLFFVQRWQLLNTILKIVCQKDKKLFPVPEFSSVADLMWKKRYFCKSTHAGILYIHFPASQIS